MPKRSTKTVEQAWDHIADLRRKALTARCAARSKTLGATEREDHRRLSIGFTAEAERLAAIAPL